MADADNFQPTRWSRVLQAQSPRESSRISALDEIAKAYWKPLYWFARRGGLSPADAEDAIQSFFARLLERDWLDRADPERGRLRNFLLTLLKRHLNDLGKIERAAKRGGGQLVVSIDTQVGEQLLDRSEGEAGAGLEAGFDREWARAVFAHALEALRSELSAKGKADHFDAYRPLLAGDAEGEHPDLADDANRAALHRLRNRLREILRAEVAETLLPGDDSAAELRYLGSLL